MWAGAWVGVWVGMNTPPPTLTLLGPAGEAGAVIVCRYRRSGSVVYCGVVWCCVVVVLSSRLSVVRIDNKHSDLLVC